MSALTNEQVAADWGIICDFSNVAGYALGLGNRPLARLIASMAVIPADRLTEAGREEGALALVKLQEFLDQHELAKLAFADAQEVRKHEIDGAGYSLIGGLKHARAAHEELGALAMKALRRAPSTSSEEDN